MPVLDEERLVKEKLLCATGDLEAFANELELVDSALPRHINADPGAPCSALIQRVEIPPEVSVLSICLRSQENPKMAAGAP